MRPEAASYSVAETLRDGRRITIRALQPDDQDEYLAAVGRLGSQSLHRRFFTVKRHFSEQERSFFLNIDFVKHVALVAVIEQNGGREVVGGARYVIAEPNQAEVAFTVVDRYQGLGIGSALMRHIVRIARDAGLHALVAQVLPSNSAMLQVFKRAGLPLNIRRETDTVYVTLDLLAKKAPSEGPMNQRAN
jgi:RimJ/RimL family protein N-acetyltransferase